MDRICGEHVDSDGRDRGGREASGRGPHLGVERAPKAKMGGKRRDGTEEGAAASGASCRGRVESVGFVEAAEPLQLDQHLLTCGRQLGSMSAQLDEEEGEFLRLSGH